MKLNRKKIGYSLILFAVTILLIFLSFVIYDKFKLEQGYKEFLEKPPVLNQEQKQWIDDYTKKVENMNKATTDPFVEGGAVREDTPFNDEIVAYINIPKINLKEPIRLGASEENLLYGAAQVSGTGLPFGGEGRSVIAGHRSYYNELKFLRINELEAGDEIYIVLPDKVLTYKVENQEIIHASEWEQLIAKDKRDMITLLTCDPLYPPFNHRLLVNAERVVDKDTQVTTSLADSAEKVIKEENGSVLYYLAYKGFVFITLGLVILFIIKRKK